MMKKLLTISVVFIAFACMASAQKKRGATKSAASALPAISLSEAMRQYRFSDAEAILNSEISTLRKKNLDVSEAESRLRAVSRAKSRMHATEKITFVDSVVVNKADFLNHYFLSSENGSLSFTGSIFNVYDTLGCTAFVSQFADQLVFAKADEEGQVKLYRASKMGDSWDDVESLSENGLGEHGDVAQNYPFMMNDGTTLYYAAKGEESFGGYDIFMTRFDADERRFLSPENIGMPFNSPANDYLYAVDEFHNIGWFATDRNQPADTVCIYTFIPNKSRRIYNAEEIDEDRLRAFARLNSIAETMQDEASVNNALATIEQIKNEQRTKIEKSNGSMMFVLNDNTVYTSAKDFKNPVSQQKLKWYTESLADLQRETSELELLREKYLRGNADEKKTLTDQILKMESHQKSLHESLGQQEKELRKLETN